MNTEGERILMGNEAIGRGLLENGCGLAASYPGTPASEILASAVDFAGETKTPIHLEWSVNEKVAFEVALAYSYTGKRAAVAMKQVGLNVASDPVTRAAYLGTKGGLVLIVADDPGPHSSQTEQDSRLFALFAKIPVFDPASPKEAGEMVREAFALSERYEIPVMLRPTTRVCHARQNVPCAAPEVSEKNARFEKNVSRWVATPQFLQTLHRELNDKLDAIGGDVLFYPSHIPADGTPAKGCIVASGVAYAHAFDIMNDMGLIGKVDLYQVRMPYPLNKTFIGDVLSRYEKVLVLEETDAVIELQLGDRRIKGRASGHVPRQGELTPDVVEDILRAFLEMPAASVKPQPKAKGRRPSLCAGCGHRSAFYAIKETFPDGIFPSDIGCYTLGMNFGAVDTCHCMGACISQGAGFYRAFAQDGLAIPTTVVTIGDSTFFHAGIPGLINAVIQGARFILVILDNGTTAMTGHQPTPQSGRLADGRPGKQVMIPELLKACGIEFLKECDAYDVDLLKEHLRDADRFTRSETGGVAVIIARHPCIVGKAAKKDQPVYAMTVTDDCMACKACIDDFECPAIVFDEEQEKAVIDQNLCIGCGVCRHVCPVEAIVAEGGIQ